MRSARTKRNEVRTRSGHSGVSEWTPRSPNKFDTTRVLGSSPPGLRSPLRGVSKKKLSKMLPSRRLLRIYRCYDVVQLLIVVRVQDPRRRKAREEISDISSTLTHHAAHLRFTSRKSIVGYLSPSLLPRQKRKKKKGTTGTKKNAKSCGGTARFFRGGRGGR